jgi:hypothetical protein
MTTNPKDRIIERREMECVMYGLGYGHIVPIKVARYYNFSQE